MRALLDEHDIAYYETSPGFWNISLGGLRVREDAAFAEAKRLMGVDQRSGEKGLDSSSRETIRVHSFFLSRPSFCRPSDRV